MVFTLLSNTYSLSFLLPFNLLLHSVHDIVLFIPYLSMQCVTLYTKSFCFLLAVFGLEWG